MQTLINPDQLQAQLQYALISYFISAFIMSPILTLATWRFVKGRRGVFLMVTLGLFLVFTLVFYGLGFVMRHVWMRTEDWGEGVIFGLSLTAGLITILVLAIPLRIALNESVSPLQVEYEGLGEEQMTPMDMRRKDHMTRYGKK